jgi:hypothetical protein
MFRILSIFALLFLFGAATTYAQGPVYNSIGGTVWKETLPVNNIMDSGEDALEGVLVSLKDSATDATIASAVSGSDGAFYLLNYVGPGTYYLQYDYPPAGFTLVAKRMGSNTSVNSAADPSTGQSDNFVIASNTFFPDYNLGVIAKPNTVTYCGEMDFDVTIWNDTFSLPKFNNTATDSLLKATLYVAEATHHPFIGVENTGTQSTIADFGFSGRLTITPPGATNLVTNSSLAEEVSLSSYDGTTDYEGASGYSWYDLYSSATNSRVLNTIPQVAPYLGTGMIDFPTQAKSITSFSGGGNLESNVETEVGAGFCITYEYLHTAPLPVSLKSFSISTDGKQSFLNWTTAMEYQNKGFAVERSTDGKNFGAIDFVKSLAINGISSTDIQYNYTDTHPTPGYDYYRLKQIDMDGKSVYSKTLAVYLSDDAAPEVYPNPGRDFVKVNAAKEDKVIVLDLSGKVLRVVVTDLDRQKMIQTNNLPDGNYYVKIISESGNRTLKFAVLH